MSNDLKAAAAQPRSYEYQVKDTPAFTVIDETWELVDIWPKRRGQNTIYLMVFRREITIENGYNTSLDERRGEK